MRKIKLLMPLGIVALSSATLPLISCGSNKINNAVNVKLTDSTKALGFSITQTKTKKWQPLKLLIVGSTFGDDSKYYNLVGTDSDLDSANSTIKIGGQEKYDGETMTLSQDQSTPSNYEITFESGAEITGDIEINIAIKADKIYHKVSAQNTSTSTGVTITSETKYIRQCDFPQDSESELEILFEVSFPQTISNPAMRTGAIKIAGSDEPLVGYEGHWEDYKKPEIWNQGYDCDVYYYLKQSAKEKITGDLTFDMRAGDAENINLSVELYTDKTDKQFSGRVCHNAEVNPSEINMTQQYDQSFTISEMTDGGTSYKLITTEEANKTKDMIKISYGYLDYSYEDSINMYTYDEGDIYYFTIDQSSDKLDLEYNGFHALRSRYYQIYTYVSVTLQLLVEPIS